MKIRETHSKSPSIIKGSGRTSNTGGSKKMGSAGESQSTPTRAVDVSSAAKLASAIELDSSRRSDKVAQIKMDVESGKYEPDAEETANKLIDTLTDYSLA